MAEDSENSAPSGGVPQADDLETRIAAIESRLDQIDAALKKFNDPDILQQQHLAFERHEELLEELRREQKSITEQTGFWFRDIRSMDGWEGIFWRGARYFGLIVTGVSAIVFVIFIAFLIRASRH